MTSTLLNNTNLAIQTFGRLEQAQKSVSQASELIAKSIKSGHKLLTCGNGGSAAQAIHLATEFVCRFNQDRQPYPAICLSSQGGDLTAIGNDYSFEKVFSRQVQAFARKGDVLAVFTTSGKSKNIISAMEAAEEKGIDTIAFLGKSDSPCQELATVEILVPDPVTARIQEAHLLLLHTLCQDVENIVEQRVV